MHGHLVSKHRYIGVWKHMFPSYNVQRFQIHLAHGFCPRKRLRNRHKTIYLTLFLTEFKLGNRVPIKDVSKSCFQINRKLSTIGNGGTLKSDSVVKMPLTAVQTCVQTRSNTYS